MVRVIAFRGPPVPHLNVVYMDKCALSAMSLSLAFLPRLAVAACVSPELHLSVPTVSTYARVDGDNRL